MAVLDTIERPRVMPDRRAAAAHGVRRFAAPGVGLLGAVVAYIGAGIPSYWGDEAASVYSATRPLGSLFAELGRVDAVHGAYYLFLHFWIELVGSSEAAVRFPSAVAVGFAAAGTVVLARQLFGPSMGLLTGLIFVVIPQVTRMGIEARTYAFTMAAAVWLTSYLITLIRRRETRRSRWVLYAVSAAASLYLFLYFALLVVVHLAVVVVLRPGRDVGRRWLRSLAVAAVLAAPIILIGLSQRGQIAFLANRNYATARSVLMGQWFGNPLFATIAWTLIAIGLIGPVLVVALSRRHPAFMQNSRVSQITRMPGLIVAGVWLVFPTAALLAANAWVTPMYNLRYVSFCTPAVAILMALGVRMLAELASWGHTRRRERLQASPQVAERMPLKIRRGVIAAGLVLVIVGAVPSYHSQRGPYAKDVASDLRQSAEAICANAAAGDAILFDNSVKASRKPRLALNIYPSCFAELDDVALVAPASTQPGLWDVVDPVSAITPQLSAHDVVWFVGLKGGKSTDAAALRALGFTLERTITVKRTVIYKFVKE